MDQTDALKLLISEYPLFKDEEVRIVKQFNATDGRVYNCFLIETSKPGYKRFVAKSFVRNPDSLKREWSLLKLLRQKNAYAPRLVIDDHEPERFLLMEYIDGIAASKAVEVAADKDVLFSQLGEATGLANSVELETFGNILEPSDISWKQYVLSSLEDKQRVVKGLIKQELYNEVVAIINRTSHVLDSESEGKAMLVHHDIYLENFLVSSTGDKVTLIDYGIAYGGRPLFDLAKFYIWDLTRYPAQRDSFLTAYGKYVQIPANFNEVMKFYLFFEVFGMIAYFQKISATKERDEALIVLENLVHSKGTITVLLRD